MTKKCLIRAGCWRDCRTSSSFTKSIIGVKSKNRRRTAEGFYIVLLCFQIIINFNNTVLLRGNKQKKISEICENTVGNGPPCFLLAGDLVGNTPNGSPLLYGHFPKSCQQPLGNAQMVTKSFYSHFQKCLGINFVISFTLPSKQHVSVY